MHLARAALALLLSTALPARATAAEPGPDAEFTPPPPPYKKGLVLDSSLGAHGFAGQFGHVAAPGVWLHSQLGYEFFRWFMLFAEGDLYFSDTSHGQDESQSRAFPIFGFGLGPRLTARLADKFAIYGQGSVGLLKADVPTNALRILGFGNAESFGPYAGGRVGAEYYQSDRHLALGLNAGLRDATNFKKSLGSDLPLLWDAGVALRYTF